MRQLFLVGVASVVLVASGSAHVAQNQEDAARDKYNEGLGFMQKGLIDQALADFRAAVTMAPKSGVAGDALVAIARYQIDVKHDLDEAKKVIGDLTKDYELTSAGAEAYAMDAQITLARSRAKDDVQAAIANLERARNSKYYAFPGSGDLIPMSLYYQGEALRTGRHFDDALDMYARVAEGYPGSPWAAKALLATAACLTDTGKGLVAMEVLQHVRTGFPNTAEAATAQNWNTILYRLYLRTSESRYSAGESLSAPKDVIDVAVDEHGGVFVSHQGGVSALRGALKSPTQVQSASAMAFMLDGTLVVAKKGSLFPDGAPAVALSSASDGQKALDDVRAIAVNWRGEWLVIDGKYKGSVRLFSKSGDRSGPFASVGASRLAVNNGTEGLGDVAVLDKETRTIVVVNSDGNVNLGSVTSPAGAFGAPVDIAFDALGHLYVLDQKNATVFVFSRERKPLTQFTLSERNAKLVALAVDAAGRVYVLDDGLHVVHIYQ
jgi:TolA-binding protein